MKLLKIILLINFIALMAIFFYFEEKINKLTCEIQEGFTAERRFVWPILREKLNSDPVNYGKEFKNPINTKYLCN